MKSKQTRRSISITQETYIRVKAYGKAYRRSMSSIIEEAVESFLPQSAEGATRLSLIRKSVLKKQRGPGFGSGCRR